MTPAPFRRRPAAAAAVACATALACGTALLAPGTSTASSHREAPLISGLPLLDNTDVYAFVSPDKADEVTFVANWLPFQEPNGGPNFYPWSTTARHDVNIDNDGDAKPDVTYRWTFRTQVKNDLTFLYNTGKVTSLSDPALNVTQTYDLDALVEGGKTSRIVTGGGVAPSNVGPGSMPDYAGLRAAAVTPVIGGGRSFVGQTEDPFFADLRVFDLLYGGDLSEISEDTLAGYNVNTVVLSVPKSAVALNGTTTRNPVIGVWSDTDVPRVTVLDGRGGTMSQGDFVQVSRLGHPLVNEVVLPLREKDRFNASLPEGDGQFASSVTDPEVPRLIQAIYGIPAPKTPRADLVEIFLTGICTACGPIKADLNSQTLNADVAPGTFVPSEMLRLNMSIPTAASPNRLGVLGGDLQGFPNGRRLADDVLDIELRALEGGAVSPNAPPLGDGVDGNDAAFSAVFPFVALPSNRSVNRQ